MKNNPPQMHPAVPGFYFWFLFGSFGANYWWGMKRTVIKKITQAGRVL